MEREDTKQRIIKSALDLFSKYGYEAVSVDQIAKAVGIKAPSLYKHYNSKQDIFEAVFREMDSRYSKQVTSMEMHLNDAGSDTKMFNTISEDALVIKVKELVEYSLHEEYVCKFRKMLTIEQFRKREFSELYTKRYVNSMVAYHEQLFKQLITCGILKDEDAYIMSLQYVCPICVFINLCDREPEKENDVMVLLERHIRQFCRMYGKKE